MVEIPLYDYKCKDCGFEFEGLARIAERYDTRCPSCSGEVEIVITKPRQISLFPEGWWEHIDLKPIYIRSRRQLREELKKRSEDPFKAAYSVYDDGIAGF